MDNQDKNAPQVGLSQPQGVPISALPHKEGAPTPIITQSEAQPRVEAGLKEFGVDVINQNPVIPPDISQLGVSHSPSSTPAPEKYSSLQIPTREEVQVLAKGPVGESKTWWASLKETFFKRSSLVQGGGAI